ncbi:MAG: peptidoglycan-binding protein [Bacillaceae bacterium]|nr:peptidoglycan-binding protein [Bacillaceae bacterium]
MLGYFNHSITGYFGPITESAVKQFQKDHNLISDGLVTTSTIEKLGQVIETKKNTGHRVTF